MKQTTYTLPASAWTNIEIAENNEKLVLLSETEKLKIGWVKKGYEALFLVRQTVAQKLYKVSESLTEGLVLIVIEGYRTTKSQQEEWERVWQIIKSQNQDFSDEETEKAVRMLVAKPLPLANHHCGGAIDVTLGYADGSLVDMGTPYITSIPEKEVLSKIPMLSENISEEVKVSRKILRDAMEVEDFVWYPGEWWHYCYGDRMWALYSGKTECFYGSIEP